MAKNKKKQHSITTQITLTIVGLVAGTVLLCWLLNVTLLEGYYTCLLYTSDAADD